MLLLLLVHDRSDAWLIYAVALAYGALGTVFYPARAALLKIMLPEELLAEANGVLTSTREGLRIIAPLAGAGLYAVLGGGAVAVLDSATFAASVFFLSRMRVHEEKPAPSEHHFTRGGDGRPAPRLGDPAACGRSCRESPSRSSSSASPRR